MSDKQVDSSSTDAKNRTVRVSHEVTTEEDKKSRRNGFFQRARNVINQTETSVSWIAGLVGLIGTFWLATGYVDRKIDQQFSQKIGPYEDVLQGMTLVNASEYDSAIPELESAFQAFINTTEKTPQTSSYDVAALVTIYLEALANATSPEDHTTKFERILEIEEENKIAFKPWNYHEIGWVYLRTGNLEEAQQAFRSAVQGYSIKEYFPQAAGSYWALTLVELCQGDVEGAMSNYEEARMRDFSYSLESTLNIIETMEEDSWYRRLITSYDMEEYLPEFSTRLQEMEES